MSHKIDFSKLLQGYGGAPENLLLLADFQHQRWMKNKQFRYSGYFRLTDTFLIRGIPLPDPQLSENIVLFGVDDSDGSAYGFWVYEETTLHEAPIIFLGALWYGNTIVANSLNEFFSLLGLGVEELGYAIHFGPDWLNQIPRDNPENLLFRKWLNSELGILIPEDPIAVVEDAGLANPSFPLWLEQKTGLSPEEPKRPHWD